MAIAQRTLLRFLGASLMLAMFALAPAAADPWRIHVREDVGNLLPHPVATDQGTRRPRHTASLEEFFEIDDDAEQYFKPVPVLRGPVDRVPALANDAIAVRYRGPPPASRLLSVFPTGPPST